MTLPQQALHVIDYYLYSALHQSAPVERATQNSVEGNLSVMPDSAGADTFDIETEQREGWAYDPL